MHEYLIDQVQFTGAKPHTSSTLQAICLQFNHLVKEIFWVCQLDLALTVVPYVPVVGNADAIGGGGGNDWFNFVGNSFALPGVGNGGQAVAEPAGAAGGIVFDAIQSAQLQLNGHACTLEHPAIYFCTVQPWQHHTSIPNSFIYCYSFALFPEDVKQPSGSLNMSRIDNVTLWFTFPTTL